MELPEVVVPSPYNTVPSPSNVVLSPNNVSRKQQRVSPSLAAFPTDPFMYRDIFVSALKQIDEDAEKHHECVTAELNSKFEQLKEEIEKERQTYLKTLVESSRKYDIFLKNETAKFQAEHANFFKERAKHLQALEVTVSEHEKETKKLFTSFEERTRNLVKKAFE